VAPGFLDGAHWRALAALVRARDAAGEFRPAAVGAGAARAVRADVRGDRIQWVYAPAPGVEQSLFMQLEELRLGLNAALMLGLLDVECHYAIYGAGARYVRHLDRSPAGAERAVSLVVYLNEDWGADDGGALRLYADDGAHEITPAGGTLVLFLSERFEHEVLPAQRARLSLTGWFRRRARL
jgi:SM-20-related protein